MKRAVISFWGRGDVKRYLGTLLVVLLLSAMLGLGLYFMTGNVVTISKERRAPIFFPPSSPSSFSSDTWRDFEKINWGTGSVGRADNRSSGISRSAKVQTFQHFFASCIVVVDNVLTLGRNNLSYCLLFTRLVEVTWGWRRELPGLNGPSGPSGFNFFLTGSQQSPSLSLEV